MTERTYQVAVLIEIVLNGDEDAAVRNVDEILQDAWDRTKGGRLTASTPWHFEIDDDAVHGFTSTTTEGTDMTSSTSTDETDGTGDPTAQMSYKDALDYAIFCLNTFMHPDASEARDVIALEAHSGEIIATLADIRETVQGMSR